MKVGMISLGCPKNLVDSEVMLGLAEQAGHTLTSDAADAEVLIVNTCAFIDKSKQESINAILEMAELKKTGACRRLVVTGCLAERYKDELRDQIPEIDALLGTGEVPDIVRALGTERSDPFVTKALTAKGAVPMTLHRKAEARPAWGTRRAAHLPLRRRDAATAGDAGALRLRQGGRGLRLHVRVLHHPASPWPLSQPARRRDRPRSASTGQPRCQGAAPDQPGHHVLRQRPGRARRTCPPAARVEQGGRPRVDPPALPLPDHDRRHDARGDGRVRQGVQVHRPAAPARLRRRVEADEASRHAPELRAAAHQHPDPHAWRRATDDVHRRVPRRNRGRRRGTRGVPRHGPLRPRRHLHLFARRRHRGRRLGRRRAGRDEAEAPGPADGATARDRRRRRSRPGLAAASGWSSTARRPNTNWCCAAVCRPRPRTSTRWSTSPNATPPRSSPGSFWRPKWSAPATTTWWPVRCCSCGPCATIGSSDRAEKARLSGQYAHFLFLRGASGTRS